MHDERPEHDQWCESEFIVEAGGYTPCDCDNRNELRRRGFTVACPPSSTEGADPFAAVKELPEWREVAKWIEFDRTANQGTPLVQIYDAARALVAAVEGSEGA